jgi:hypothetical protein
MTQASVMTVGGTMTKVDAGDVISRAEAVKAAESMENISMAGGPTGNAYGTAERIANAIRALPAVQPVAAGSSRNSLHATCRRVWVCKRCGNCLDHCKHDKNESNFREDLSMPCSGPCGCADCAPVPVAAGMIGSVTEALEEFNSTPCAVCGESGNTLPCIKCGKPLCEEHAVGTTWCPEHAPVAAGGENNNAK